MMTLRQMFWAFVMILTLAVSGCGYNTFQTGDEQVKASWAEVLNQYQRRADLIPNLVNTVKGYAKYEQDTLVAVVDARAKATAINATPELVNDPQAFARFVESSKPATSGFLLFTSTEAPHARSL
jgi:LemA protein